MVELKNRELLAKAVAAGLLKSQLLEKTNELSKKLVLQSTRRFSCSNPLTALDQVKLSAKRNRLSGSNTSLQSLDGKLAPQRKGVSVHRKYSQQAAQVTTPVPSSAEQQWLSVLPKSVRDYVEENRRLTNCKSVHVCDGSDMEREWLIRQMLSAGMITPLRRHENCWLARTDPQDVARVESKTFICTRDKHDVVPRGCREEARCSLGNWMHVNELETRLDKLLPGCMSGRTMYVIPFSMGPIGSRLSKVGIQLTDSPYVVASMHIMTRVSRRVLELIANSDNGAAGQSVGSQGDYVRCFHSVGCPLPSARPIVNSWPCNPEQTIIAHIPERREIVSYGSGYGGNSLLGKKCFALRLGSIMGKQEGWLAEHMLVLGITNLKTSQKKYIAAAFPSACGKTNLAMMTPSLPGYKIECVGDDIAWMRFDESGSLRAINPEAGFFGVAPGTSEHSNPNAMRTVQRNTIFTNVAETSDGSFYWEGLEGVLDPAKTSVRDWKNQPWTPGCGRKAAHPNSRFCSPASQCPIIDPDWESPEGVPISAIIFGGRRPEGVPLVYEAFDWQHGVYVGASMRSESTAAAEHTGKQIMHDPFAMRPFFGYNFAEYLKHWLSFARKPALKLPKVFHVNWFRRDAESGEFLWPGFGENIRVLDWICRRIDGEKCATPTPIGLVPAKRAFNLEGLNQDGKLDEDKLFAIERDFWLEEQRTIDEFLRINLGQDLPEELAEQSESLRRRLTH